LLDRVDLADADELVRLCEPKYPGPASSAEKVLESCSRFSELYPIIANECKLGLTFSLDIDKVDVGLYGSCIVSTRLRGGGAAALLDVPE